MNDAPTPPSELPSADPHTGPGAWARGVIERQVALQEQLAEAGLRLALAIEQGATQAVAEGRAVDKDAAMAFSRVARTVRMGGLLQAKLIKDLEQVQHRAEAEQLRDAKRVLAACDAAGGEAEDPALLEPAERHKYRVTRIVARIAAAEHDDDEEEVDRLVDEAAERLDDEDIYDDLLARPIGELVSLICRDLDLEPKWDRLAGEAWAKAEIASGAPNSPFAILNAARAPPFAAANGGEGELCDRQGRSCERPPIGRAGLADPGAKPGEERVGVGEGHIHPPFNRSPERPHTWSG
jgi:hypothetical protein